NLTAATLNGAKSSDLVGCPVLLPSSWICTSLANGRDVLVGPKADLIGADLTGANLAGADLTGAKTSDLLACPSNFPGDGECRQQPATGHFIGADQGVDLSGADLSGANLNGTPISSGVVVAFEPLDLRNVNLRNTKLTGATLSGADLRGADLTGADLRGVDV